MAIHVTKAKLPPIDSYMQYLEQIWRRCHLTNFGPLSLELEEKLKQYLSAEHFYFVANGTLALQLAIHALGKKGEVITTPFSYVATTSSIVWEGCTPVFADIDPLTLNIDPDCIEANITENTIAILATHVYGNPCDVNKIEAIAKKHHLKVIYDAAQAFGVYYEGIPLVNYGDMSILSFHATKIFHTVEGGGLITQNDVLAQRIQYMRNFGHQGAEAFQGVGINAKNSEFHAAMGLCLLPNVEDSIQRRQYLTSLYNSYLLQFDDIRRPLLQADTDYNYHYYPIIFRSESDLLAAKYSLQEQQIYPRRYFYPSLNQLNYLTQKFNVPIADDIAKRVLCLPLYDDLSESDVIRICELIIKALSALAA